MKPIKLKNGHCSGAQFFTYTQDEKNYLRKLIYGKTIKLEEQFNWLKLHSENPYIPKVFNPIKKDDCFSYDMPFFENSKNAYQLLKEGQLTRLKEIIEALDSLKSDSSEITKEQVKKYLSEKLIHKINQCLNEDPKLVEKYPETNELLSELTSKSSLLESGINYNIHGDATLENILINKEGLPILIDPNGENSISSFEVEMAKLFQSLNSHYEDLTLGLIDFNGLSQETPSPLFDELLNIIKERGGDESVQRTYFHEVIHLARLLPYKQKNQQDKFETFFKLFLIRSKEFLNR